MKVQTLDDGGVYLSAEQENEHIQALSVVHESGSVMFRVTLGKSYRAFTIAEPLRIDEPLQYLTPQEAMALANGLERCAIAALKEGA